MTSTAVWREYPRSELFKGSYDYDKHKVGNISIDLGVNYNKWDDAEETPPSLEELVTAIYNYEGLAAIDLTHTHIVVVCANVCKIIHRKTNLVYERPHSEDFSSRYNVNYNGYKATKPLTKGCRFMLARVVGLGSLPSIQDYRNMILYHPEYNVVTKEPDGTIQYRKE